MLANFSLNNFRITDTRHTDIPHDARLNAAGVYDGKEGAMKRYVGLLLGLLVLMSFVPSAEAAIIISGATIQYGQVFIFGAQAQTNAAISWENVALGIASNSSGAFQFNTTNLPADCVGHLKIGTEERNVVINNCTPAPISIIEAVVAATGQYRSFALGDDGDLKKGVSTKLLRLSDNGNGTLTDNLTRLIWLRNANCPLDTRDWATALSDVATLNASGTMNGHYCGDTSSNAGSHQTDWRLPNVRELQSLMDYGNEPALPCCGQNFFAMGWLYWSSTTYAWDPTAAWLVGFTNGGIVDWPKTYKLYVLAVRGGSVDRTATPTPSSGNKL